MQIELIVILFFTFLIGAVTGSFINMLVWRLKRDLSIFGRSHSDEKFAKQLQYIDLIPIISFIIFRGKSHTTGEKLPVIYPLTELITALLFAFHAYKLFNSYETDIQFLTAWVIGAVLIFFFVAYAVYDILYWEVDIRLVGGNVIFLMFSIFIQYFILENIYILPTPLSSLGASVIAASFIAIIFKLTNGGGMGVGDIFLFGVVGLTVGLKLIYPAFMLTVVIGAIYGVLIMILKKGARDTKVQFAPFISLGALLCFLFSSELLQYIDTLFLLN